MSPRSSFRSLRNLARGAVAVGVCCICLTSSPRIGAGADGEQTDDAGAQQSSGSSPSDDGASETTETSPGDDTPPRPSETGKGASERGGSGSEASEPPPEKRVRAMVDRWGLTVEADQPLEETEGVRESLSTRRDELGERVEALGAHRDHVRSGVESLDDQIRHSALPEEARQTLAVESAIGAARVAVLGARRDGLNALQSELEAALETVDERIAALEAEARDRAGRDADEQRRVEEARQAEKSALQALEQARAEQQQERNREIKNLIAERSEILSKIAEVARGQSERIQTLGSRRASIREQFDSRRDRIDETIASLPEDPREQTSRKKADSVFRDIRQYRREARQQYANELDQLETAISRRGVAERDRARAESDLVQVKSRAERFGDSELARRKIEVAEAKLDYRRRIRDKWDDIVAAHRKILDLHAERLDFYAEAVERVLPKISEQARETFFSIWKTENWRGVGAAIDETRRFLSRKTNLRLQQIKELPNRLYEAELWGWVFGLLWRLLTIPAVIFLLRNYSRPVTQRLMDALLHRNFFRQHAAGTLKFGELLRSIVWPTALFGTGLLVATYVAAALPEFEVVIWGVEVLFIYWVVLTMIKVLFLPRRYREQAEGLMPAPDLGRFADRSHLYGGDVIDIASLELEQAKRLVRTGRHILLFALAGWLVPLLFAEVVGHNVLWKMVDTGFSWAIIAIVYYELSIWRDDVAAVFRKLAGARVPRAADFVDQQKDRVYGVLIIALATVFVIVAEIYQLARRYIVDTEVSKSVGNFLFRKKIELKQKERAEESDQEAGPKTLPDDYVACFSDRPLVDERFLIERPEVLDPITETWEEWLDDPRQGSVTITGEKGIGKTTVLNQLYTRFVDDDRAPEVVYTQLCDKIEGDEELLAFLTRIFELDEVPASSDALVERLLEARRKVIILDDCHHMFLRKIGGFTALTALFDIVNLTDHHHFWVMAFNKYGWRYLDRVHEQQHFFGRTLDISPWSASELKQLIDRRNETLGYPVSFTDLVVMPDDRQEAYYEVVKTARGYFRLLQDFCQGNPRVAMAFWLNNLSPDGENTLQVRLFERPSLEAVSDISDDHLFVLTALVQHGALNAHEVAEIINAEPGFCQRALDYFHEEDLARKHRGSGRYTLTPFYYRPIVSRLTSLNFLWS